MMNYRVKFFGTSPGLSGHKYLRQEIDVVSESPSGALVLAEAQLKDSTDLIESVEVVRVAGLASETKAS